MLNKQAPEKKVSNALLDVHSIFSTIQGEGPYSGKPAVFIRLAGCNLQCPGCDTDYTTNRSLLSVDEIVKEVCTHKPRLVVVTGGEPFRQSFGPLVSALYSLGKKVQVETNGTLFQEGFPYSECILVCSPKTPKVDKRLLPYIQAWKYVVDGSGVTSNHLPITVLGLCAKKPVFQKVGGDIYIQPADNQDATLNRINLDIAVNCVIQGDYTLTLQTHKIAGVE